MSEKDRLKPGAAMRPCGELAYMGCCWGGEPAGKEAESEVRATCMVFAQSGRCGWWLGRRRSVGSHGGRQARLTVCRWEVAVAMRAQHKQTLSLLSPGESFAVRCNRRVSGLWARAHGGGRG